MNLLNLRPTVEAWALGLIVTGVTIWMPHVAVGYRNPSLNLVLDSVGASAAILVAYLVYGRFLRRRGMLQDLLLGHCLVLLAVAGLGLSYLSEGSSDLGAGTIAVWLLLAIHMAGSFLLAAAAIANERPVKRLAGRGLAVVLPAGVIAAVFLILWIANSQLPAALMYIPESAQQALLAGHPLLQAPQAVSALCFFVASIAFSSQAVRRNDELLSWLGPACVLGAFAHVNYLLAPSLLTEWLYAGDVLRIGFFVLLVAGAAREIRQYWSAQAGAAVQDDRRRLARELHDSVIQELAYIRSESHTIPAGSASRDHIIRACDRALDEARAAVQALSLVSEEPLSFVMHRATTELAERYELEIESDLDPSISVAAEQQHALLRITREAVANAVHHGKAKRLRIRLSQDGGSRLLAIEDDGQGFDVSASAADTAGYGLISMRERASSLPGSFNVEAHSGTGSVVTVQW